MKNTNNPNNLRWSSREGQIAPIAIIIGALILGGVGGIFYFSLKKPSTPVTPTSVTSTCVPGSDANDVDCSIANAKKAFTDQTTAELNAGGKDAVAQPPLTSSGCAKDDVVCQSKPDFLDSQKELGNNWIYGPINFMEAIYEAARSAFNEITHYISNFFVSPPAKVLINLDSLPTCTPSTSCISFCKYGGDLENCRTTNADCTVSLSTKGTRCLPEPKATAPAPKPAPAPTPSPTGVQGYVRVQIANGTGYEIGLDEEIAVSDIYGFTTTFQYPSGELLYRFSYDRQAAAVTIDIAQTKPDSCLLGLDVHGTAPVTPGKTLAYIARGTLTGNFTYADACRNETELPTRPVTGTFTVSARR